MKSMFLLEKCREITSKNGNKFCDLYVRAIEPGAGNNPSWEQMKLRSFNEEVINLCSRSEGKKVILDLEIREGFINGIESVDETKK